MSIHTQLTQDSKTQLLSECFAVHPETTNIMEEFPAQAHLLPMTDSALVGIAIGMALDGSFPIVQLASSASLPPILSQLYQESRHGFPLSMVLRVPCLELRSLDINMLSTLPAAVYCAQNQAHSSTIISEARERKQPTLILESPALMATKQQRPFSGEIETVREGTDISVLTWGENLSIALQAAESYESQGISLEILVLHRLFSAHSAIGASINKTGRVICINQNHSLSSVLINQSFWRLEAEPVFCSAEVSDIASAVQEILEP